MTLLFVLYVSLILYYNIAIGFATTKAARSIMTGFVQQNNYAQADYQTKIVCASMSAFFNCSNVIVNLQTVAEAQQPAGYYSYVNSNQTALLVSNLTNSTATYSPGLPCQYEYLQIVYPITFMPQIFAGMLSGGNTYQGSPAYLAIGTAAFRNEEFQKSSTSCGQ